MNALPKPPKELTKETIPANGDAPAGAILRMRGDIKPYFESALGLLYARTLGAAAVHGASYQGRTPKQVMSVRHTLEHESAVATAGDYPAATVHELRLTDNGLDVVTAAAQLALSEALEEGLVPEVLGVQSPRPARSGWKSPVAQWQRYVDILSD